MWRLWGIIGFAAWIVIVSILLDAGTSRTLLTQLSSLAIIVLALWRLSSEHEFMVSAQNGTDKQSSSNTTTTSPTDVQI